MKISAKAIVSNSDMIRNYKSCRDKAEKLGKIFILKNNQPDAVLFSISEYEKFSQVMDLIESFDKTEIAQAIEQLQIEKTDAARRTGSVVNI